jgi:hypothetical protein
MGEITKLVANRQTNALAGQGDLASRVKPTVRRRAGLDLPAAEPAPEVPKAP